MSENKSVYWSDPKDETGKKFRVQLHIPQGKLTEIRSFFKDWSQYGESIDQNEKIFLFSKYFEDDLSFLKWKKSFPFSLKKFSEKKEISKPKLNKKEKKESGRKCGICGEHGHNSRTCSQNVGNEEKLKNRVQKLISKGGGKYRCKICGELGHNSRTCPKK